MPQKTTYVQGYFRGSKSPKTGCGQTELGKILNTNPETEIATALNRAYNFCLAATDFGDITHSQYFLLRNISVTLAESKQDFYIIDDAEVLSAITPGQQIRVEPMKTLAEASTSGKKSSSNIEKVGYFNNMLEVEFSSGESYVYFVEPDMYDRFVAAPSKGEFLWEELRGKAPGLVWGYATGTGSILKHTPGGVGSKDPVHKQYAKGSSGAPDYKPRLPTGQERGLIHKELQIQFLGKGLKFKGQTEGQKRETTIGELRSMFGQQSKLPQGDMGIPIITDKVNNLQDFGVCKKRYELLYDFYHMEDEKERNKLQKTIIKNDIDIKQDTELRGVITRAGAFNYGGHIQYKKWDNILENAKNYPILPAFGTNYTNPHKEENIPHLIGYVDNWGQDDPEQERLYGSLHTFEPIEKISMLADPKNIQVSLSMFDDSNDDDMYQNILGFRNVAVALGNQMKGRCESVEGYGSCVVNPIEDMDINEFNKKIQPIWNDPDALVKFQIKTAMMLSREDRKQASFIISHRLRQLGVMDFNHDSNVILDKSLDETISRSSNSVKEPRKIIKKKSDLHMPDEKKVKEDIAKFIEDFKKEKNDNLAISTGNEVQGNTHFDEFERTMKDEGFSPAAIASAWAKYNAQNKQAGAPIDNQTGGFVKTAPGISGDFEEKIDALTEALENQEKMIKKYEDFFKSEQNKIEAELKAKYIKPLSEENREIIEKMDFDTLEKVKPILDLYINEHPEIMPTDKTADDIDDMNTNAILKLLGKSKEDLRQNKDDMTKIKEDAIKAMEAKWSKKVN